jgi:F0F1-type ATP synthase assembly protein I
MKRSQDKNIQVKKRRKEANFYIMFGIALVTAIFGGCTLGILLESTFGLPLTVTYIGVLGMAAGILLLYKKIESRKKAAEVYKEGNQWPEIEVTVEDVRKAIRGYSDQLPKGVYRTILVNDDHSIDFEQLASTLKGIPSKKFYMSKETYDIFEENEKEIAITLDMVQKAVDLYVKENKQFPMLPYDPLNRVNYYQLMQAHCLDVHPDIELYITDYDGLVTHKKPKKNSTGND